MTHHLPADQDGSELSNALMAIVKNNAIEEALEQVQPLLAVPDFMNIPRGMSIDLDAGQVLALAREAVNSSGGSYPLIVREILAALELLCEAFKEEGAAQ